MMIIFLPEPRISAISGFSTIRPHFSAGRVYVNDARGAAHEGANRLLRTEGFAVLVKEQLVPFRLVLRRSWST